MHDAATEHVVLARLRPDEGPDALVFTTVGCLGQIGMNSEGVCVGINNLTGNDGRFGVMWPTVIRGMLAQATAAEALDVLLRADLAGAHNYLILDSKGRGFNVEAMPSARPVKTLDGEPLAHTNHVTDPAAAPFEGDSDEEMMANSRQRLELAAAMLANTDRPVDAERLMEITREPTAICRLAGRQVPGGVERRSDHAAPHRRLLGLLGPARRQRLRALLAGTGRGPRRLRRHRLANA